MKRKSLAIVLSIVLIAFFVCSILFITHEADHDCCGEDCPICEEITVLEKAIEELGTGVIAVIITCTMIFGFVDKLFFHNNNQEKNKSLVSLKIEILI